MRKLLIYIIIVTCIYTVLYILGPSVFLYTMPQNASLTVYASQPAKDQPLIHFDISIKWLRKAEPYSEDGVILLYVDSGDTWSIIEQQWDISRATLYAKTFFDDTKPHSIIRFPHTAQQSVHINAVSRYSLHELTLEGQSFHILYIHEVKFPLFPPYYWVKHGHLNYKDLIENKITF